MATGPDVVLTHLRRAVASGALASLPDPDLLRAFSAGGPDADLAFEVLVRRHGPMVLRACRAFLRGSDADDAFQATFLVLVRRAGGLTRQGCLAPWLFAVSRKVCRRLALDAGRRREREAQAARGEAVATRFDPEVAEAVAVVHEEVGRLPGSLREAVVLCELGGCSYEEAATRLGCTHAALRGRLARAKERLRWRLARRGLGPVCLPAVVVPRPLLLTTAKAAS